MASRNTIPTGNRQGTARIPPGNRQEPPGNRREPPGNRQGPRGNQAQSPVCTISHQALLEGKASCKLPRGPRIHTTMAVQQTRETVFCDLHIARAQARLQHLAVGLCILETRAHVGKACTFCGKRCPGQKQLHILENMVPI
jgi:hypothetical protein